MAFLQPRIIFIAIFFFLSLVSSTPVKLPSGSSAAVTNHISVFRGIISRGGDAKRPKYEDYVPNKTTDRVVTLVYRSDRRAPSAISNEGGFRPQGQYEDSEDAFRINLHTRFRVLDDSGNPLEENSDSEGSQESDYPDSDASDDEEPAKDYVAWPSAYVSTATSHYYAIKVNEAVEHYLYIIHAVPSMFVNDGVEDEVLAVGGIPWSLVRGWLRIGLEGEFPTLAEVEDRMEPNPAYNPQMWEGLAATPDLPSGWDQQHSRQSAINFMSQPGVGTHVGWTGRFPLPFPSPSTAGSSAEPVPGPSNQQSFHDPAVTLSEEDVVTAADYLRTREPCEDSSLDARTRHSTLEADAAFARRLASLDHARAGDATSDLIGQQDPSARAIYDRLRNAEEPSTCHLATECRGYLRRASEKREITGGLAQVCQKIFRPMGLSSTGKTKAPAQCTKIHTIHIDLSLSNAEGAGTYDQIAGTLEGPAGTAKFVFATKPWGNSKFTVSVKAKDSFNTDEINLNSIKRLNITAQGLIGFLPLYNDKFQVQDIKLRAECVDPLYRAQVNRYIGINQWMQHPAAEQTIAWPPYEPGVERVVATFDIRHRDWLFSTSCKEVKDINYELKVANVEGAGTYDKVWFTLGDKDDKEPKQTVVGYGLTAGDIKKGSVGSNEEIVPLSHLKQVAISEEHRWFRPFANTWTFESIIFTATCASSGQKLLMDKYDWIHANLYRVDDTPVWTGDFSAWDWLEVHGK